MKWLSSLLLVSFLPVHGAATDPLPIYSDPHKYFAQKLHQEVDKADSNSPDAVTHDGIYPSIDISPWINPTSSTYSERLDVVHQILAQAIDTGSFNIVGHNISVDLLDRLESSTQKFFSESIDFKRRYSSDKPGVGYTANQQEKYGSLLYKTDDPLEAKGDLREIFGQAYPSARVDNIQGPNYFQIPLREYIEQLQQVDTALTNIFSAALGLVKGVDIPLTFMNEAGGKGAGFLRAHRYPAMGIEYTNATRFVPHTDFGTLTIIYGTEKGLEEIRDGKWVEVPISKGELHITIGQVLNMWSNGLFKDNIHRVSKMAAKDRVSFAYFLAQGPQSVPVDGIEPVCAQNEQAKFPRTSTFQHITKYFAAMVEEKSSI